MDNNEKHYVAKSDSSSEVPRPLVALSDFHDVASKADVLRNTTNPKDLLGLKKVRLYLVPPASMIYQALAMEDGAKKYGPFNWRENSVIASIYIDAAMRHLMSYLDGEENASDSGKPHLGHALACLGIIVDAKETGNLIDDRPRPGAASRLINDLMKAKEDRVPREKDDQATR